MVSILASPSNAVHWSGGLRRMRHCQVQQFIDGAHAIWRFVFAADIAFITLELPLVTLKWAFSVMGKLLLRLVSLCPARELS